MLSIHFKPDELAALMEHCLRQMAAIDRIPKREGRRRNLDELTMFNFWDSLYCKLQDVFKHPTCVWCDQRDWSFDDPDTIPDVTEDSPYHPHLPPTWN